MVYKHTSPSGKVYIGITCKPPDVRFENGRGYGKKTIFGKAIRHYGWRSFNSEILYENLSETTAKQKEKELILQYKSTDRRFGYNMSLGGDGTPGVMKTKEQKQFMRERMSGERNPFYGRKHTEETKKKIITNRLYLTGKDHHSYGKHFTDEQKKKMSESHIDVSGEKNPHWGWGRMVAQYDLNTGKLIKVFDFIREAAKETNSNEAAINHCCTGRSKSSNGFYWEYCERKIL